MANHSVHWLVGLGHCASLRDRCLYARAGGKHSNFWAGTPCSRSTVCWCNWPGLGGAGSEPDDGGAGTAGPSIFWCTDRRHRRLYKLLEVPALEPLTKHIYHTNKAVDNLRSCHNDRRYTRDCTRFIVLVIGKPSWLNDSMIYVLLLFIHEGGSKSQIF